MINNNSTFEERKQALRQDFEKYMAECSQNDEMFETIHEVIHKSITGVNKRAQTAKLRREQSPLKTYGGAKSKVSQNINA